MNVRLFIVKSLAFVILFIVADQLCGFGFIMLNKTAGDKYAREEYIRHEMDADVVLLGSSHCTHHYMPDILKDSLDMSVYNCGQRGNGIIYEYGRLQTIYERYTPKIIVVDFIEGYDLQTNDNNRYLDFLKVDYGTNKAVDSIFVACDPLSPLKMLFKSYRYNSTICDLILNNLFQNRGRFSSDGFSALKGSIVDADTFTYIEKNIEIDSLKLRYIKKLAIERRDGSKIVFVISPSYNGENTAFTRIIGSIAKECEIPFFNYSYTEGISGKGEFFNDGAHLNEKGAEQFTKLLASDLKRALHD